MKMVKDLLTGIDGKTYDIVRVGILATTTTIIANAVSDLYLHRTMDYLAFGSGCAAIFAAGGFGIGQKAKTEPDKEN